MFKAFKLFTILAALALLAQPAFAQGSAPAAKPAAAAKIPVETQNFNDWRMECIAEDGKKLCQLIQQVVSESADKKKGMILVVKAMSAKEKDKSGKEKSIVRMMFLTPLGTVLPANITVKLDSEPAQPLKFLFCAQVGCIAEVVLDGPILDKFKTGKKMTASYKVMNKKQAVVANVSLNGLSAGIQALPK